MILEHLNDIFLVKTETRGSVDSSTKPGIAKKMRPSIYRLYCILYKKNPFITDDGYVKQI